MTRLAKARGQVAAEHRDCQRPGHEYPGPEQQRPFMRAPQRGDAVERGQRGVGIAGDVQHGKIEGDEGVHQRADGRAHEHELPGHRRPDYRHPARITARGAEDAEECLRAREHQREDQGEMAELGDHQVPPLRCSGTFGGGGLFFSDSRHFRRHVFLVVLGEDFIGDECAALHAAMRDHALTLAEQVRQDARIFHRHRVLEVRDQELDVERAGGFLDAALLHHAAETESFAGRRHLRRRDRTDRSRASRWLANACTPSHAATLTPARMPATSVIRFCRGVIATFPCAGALPAWRWPVSSARAPG